MTTIDDHPERQQQNWKSLTNWEKHTYSNLNSKAEWRRKPRWSGPRNFRNTEPRLSRGVRREQSNQEGQYP